MRWMLFGLVLALAIQGCMSPPEPQDEVTPVEAPKQQTIPQPPPPTQTEPQQPSEPEVPSESNDQEVARQYIATLKNEVNSMFQGMVDMVPLGLSRNDSQNDAAIAEYAEGYYKRAIQYQAPRIAKELHAEYTAELKNQLEYLYEVAEASRSGRPKPPERNNGIFPYKVVAFCHQYGVEVPHMFEITDSPPR